MRKLLHTSWIALLLLLALPLGALYYLVGTDAGLRTLASTLSRRLGPVTLTIEGVSGALARGAHFDRIVVEHRRVRVEADDATLRLAVLPLAWQTLRVPAARFGTVRIDVHHRPDEPSSWKPHFLPALMMIQADQVLVRRLVIVSPSGHEVDFDDISAQGSLYPKTIRVYAASGALSGMRLEARGELFAARPLAMRGSARWRMAPAGQPPWIADGSFEGDLARLAVDASLAEPFRATGRGALLDLAGNWRLEGRTQVQHLDLAAWGGGHALGIVTGALDLHGDRSGYRANGTLTAPGLRAGPLDLDIQGSYAARVLHVAQLTLRHAPSGSTLRARGDVGFVQHGPSLALDGEWSGLRWPLAAADAPVHDSAGQFRLAGARPWALEARGAFAAAHWPAAQFSARGTLDHDRLLLEAIDADAFGGHAELRSEVRWSPAQLWSLTGKVRQLDVAALRPAIPGRVDFALQLTGEGFGAGGAVHARLDDLGGQIRGQRASGHAWFSTLPEGWHFEDVRVQLGRTRVELSGHTGARNDLRFAIDADDLALLLPGATGRLEASGHVGGTAHDPLVALIARGGGLAWQDLRVDALRASTDFDPAGSGRADALLRLDGLRWRDRLLDSVVLESQGTAASYSAGLHVQGPGLAADARATGRFADGQWQLRLASVEVTDHKDLKLALEAPADLAVGAAGWRAGPLCLRDEAAHLCGSAGADATGWRASVGASGLPLGALTAGLVPGTAFDGMLTVDAALQSPARGSWSGSLHGALDGAAVRHTRRNGNIESLDLGSGTLHVELLPQGFDAKLLLDAGKTGRLEAQLGAHGSTPAGDWRHWPVAGRVAIDADAFGFVDSYLTEVDRVTGRLRAELSVGGALGAPQLDGALDVSDAELDAYQINLALRAVNLHAELHDNTLKLQGSGNAGVDGHGEFSGDLSWRGGLPYGNLHLSGTDLRLVNIPEARIQASPDVSLKLDGRRIDVTGIVTLPYARIEPAQLTNAVLASGDEVLVNEPQRPAGERFHVYSRLTLKLGDRVTVNTYGLSGRLGGSITETSDETGVSRATGELSVEEGKYLALGRKLDIEHGRLLFNNGLISDPGVDLRATKRFTDITAGVNVRGTLRQPRMTFFSEPAIPQSQIVSLLLAGGSLESAQGTSDTASRGAGARSGLLLQGGAIIAQQLGSRVGIEDVSVESDLANSTSLVLGRYLSPRLYVSYGISLAEAINTIKMRYTIGDRWTIKTEAGKERSADLVFTIEK